MFGNLNVRLVGEVTEGVPDDHCVSRSGIDCRFVVFSNGKGDGECNAQKWGRMKANSRILSFMILHICVYMVYLIVSKQIFGEISS